MSHSSRLGRRALPRLATILLLALLQPLAWGQNMAFIDQPVSSGGSFGSPVYLSATANRYASYQWYQGPAGDTTAPIEGATSPLLTFVRNRAGSYWVRATNAEGSIDSRAASITVQLPRLTSREFVLIGGGGSGYYGHNSSTLKPGLRSSYYVTDVGGDVTFEWFHDGVLVPNATSYELILSPFNGVDVGNYSVRVTAGDVTLTTNTRPLSCVYALNEGVVVREGMQAELAFFASGPQLTFQWTDNYLNPLPENSHFVGTQTPTLRINGVSAADLPSFYCYISNGFEAQHFRFDMNMRGRPTMLYTDTVGQASPEWKLGKSVSESEPRVSNYMQGEQLTISVTGLPPGVTFDRTNNTFSGTPTLEGTYTIKIQGRNIYGLGPVTTIKVVVLPPDHYLKGNYKGTFYGVVERDDEINRGLGGRFILTTTTNGRYTGVVTTGATVRRFSGQIMSSGDGYSRWGEAILASTRDGVPTLSLFFYLGFNADVEATGELRSANSHVNFRAVRSPWNTMIQAVHFVGSHVAALTLDPALDGDTTYPQGTGYLEGGINLSGVFTAAARFGDNTVATISTISCQDRTIPFHYLLYGGTGSVQGWASSDGQVMNGDLTWIKLAQPTKSKTRSYKSGFPAHRIGLAGGRRRAYTGNEIVMGLPDVASNAQFTLSLLGAEGDLTNTFRITRTNTAQMEAGSPLSLLINRSQSKFSGAVNYLARKGPCYGVFVDQLGMGVGHIQLPESTASSSPVLSRKIVVAAKGEPPP